jgi:uncharacterized membrane-anchored protein
LALFIYHKRKSQFEAMNNNTEVGWNKVAKITLIFWLMKIVATTLGETLGDFISMTLNLGYTVGIGITLAFFLLVLIVQLSLRKYVPAVYWLVIIGTTTLGTEISDFIDRSLHLGYAGGTVLLVSCLLLTLFLWYRKYRNLEVYPIANRQKEIYYWTAILFSNSLGTAFGDFLGDDLGLSYLTGALVTGAVIIVVVMLHYLTRINHILLFWIAFIFTRPFGATFGDFLTKKHEQGGLDLGTLNSSLVSVAIMIVLVMLEYRRTREDARPAVAV